MLYYSTNHKAPVATLEKAVVKGLAEDRGLYMPENIKPLPKEFIDNMEKYSFKEIAYTVAEAFFGEDIEAEALKKIVYDTLAFDCPIVPVEEIIYSLELFHGPTLAFKDVGARFMARLLQYFIKGKGASGKEQDSTVNVLVATSGDTGSAVANGFLGVDGIHVYVLYPKGKVSDIQESQFTTLGKNITAIEVDGVFDDCQALVKNAFMDEQLNKHMRLTSANSINVARFLPQAFYYFNAYARLKESNPAAAANLVMCVPSGNFGNICAALFGHAMGLPVKRFIAANNANDIFYNYLQTGVYNPQQCHGRGRSKQFRPHTGPLWRQSRADNISHKWSNLQRRRHQTYHAKLPSAYRICARPSRSLWLSGPERRIEARRNGHLLRNGTPCKVQGKGRLYPRN